MHSIIDFEKIEDFLSDLRSNKEIEIAFKKIPFMVISNLHGEKQIMVNEKDVEAWVEQKGGHYIQIDMKNLKRLESTFKNLVAEIVSINNSS